MKTITIAGMTIAEPAVTFPEGQVRCSSAIAWFTVSEKYNACFVLLKESCFHPRDFRWPDQPSDRGSLKAGNEILHVLDVVKMLAVPDMEPLFDIDIPFTKRDLPEQSRLLGVIKVDIRFAQLLEHAMSSAIIIEGQVDEEYRLSLSTGHAAGHLASYALNEVMAPYWRKPIPLDTRGFPDFIRQTQDQSKVIPYGCQDGFRLGKSTRKAGLNVAELATDLPAIESKANLILARWLKNKPEIYFEKEGIALDDSRVWHCRIGEESFSMFCGGTHVKSFGHVSHLKINLEFDVQEQQMQFHVAAAV